MKNIYYVLIALLATGSIFAQEKRNDVVDFTVGFETNHLWRGLIVSDKPTFTGMVTVNIDNEKHWTAGFWGGAAIANENDGTHYKEIDYYVQYAHRNFVIGLWDLFNMRGLNKPKVFNYKDKETTHILDLRTGYYLGDKFPMSLQANVLLYGNADKEIDMNGDGKQRYSGYIEASYPVYKGKVSLNTFVGAGVALNGKTHLYGNSKNKFDVVNVGVSVAKKVRIGNYNLPVSGMVTWNPSNEYVRMQLAATLF